MLLGAHVSPAGGPAQAVARGVERGCRAIQIFNQNPRAWRPREYSADEVAEFREAMAASEVETLVIHAVYLLNCASEDEEICRKSVQALIGALRAGAMLGAHAVVLHPGSALKGTADSAAAIERAAASIAEALAESEECPMHLENTAGGGATLGRSFEEIARMIESAGGDERLGVCLDSCHLYASGHDIRTAEQLSSVLDDFDRIVGLDRLGSLHCNDSKTALGSNSDRHAPLGEGELRREGCAAFLSEPRFEGLPCIFEGPGLAGKGATAEDIALMAELRAEGLEARSAA